MQEIWIQSLGWEDLLDKGNGNPLQYSCLENPMDRGAWWATVHGAAESYTTEHLFFFLLAWEMSAIVWMYEYSLVLPFLGIGMRIDIFQSCGHRCIFQIC